MDAIVLSWEALSGFVWQVTQAKLYGFSVLDFICCVRVCSELRKQASFKTHFLRSLIMTFITHFGGTTVAAILMGRSPGWAATSAPTMGVLLAWYLVFFCPGDVFHVVYKWRGVNIVARVFECINTAYAIGSLGLNNALHSAVGKATTSVLMCGVVSGCGGGVMLELGNLQLRPAEVRRANSMQSVDSAMKALLLAALYLFVLCDPYGLLWAPLGRAPPMAGVAEGVAALAILNTAVTLLFPEAVHWPADAAERFLPGFQSAFVPTELGLQDNAAPEAAPAKRQRATPPRKQANGDDDSMPTSQAVGTPAWRRRSTRARSASRKKQTSRQA